MSDTVDCCPECGTTREIYVRQAGSTYYCRECDTEYDEPGERDANNHTAPTRGPAAELYHE